MVLFSPHSAETGEGVGPWRDFERYVRNGSSGIHPAAVYHGFATAAEAAEYWRAARGDLPLPVLPPWRA